MIIYQVPFSFFNVPVEIYLDDTLVFESELPGNFRLEQPVFAKAGTYQLRIYVNEQLSESREITFGE